MLGKYLTLLGNCARAGGFVLLLAVPKVSSEEPHPPLSLAPSFVGDARQEILPPNLDPRVRINPEAPSPFIAMADAYQRGDREAAFQYARQFVRYLNNLMFQVKDLTQIIGEAMIREGIIQEEDWVGVEQYLDRQFATAREENGSLAKVTHEEAMKRITPDPKNEAEIYFFFSLGSSWSRQMAPDVERLWRATKSDKRVKMVALTTRGSPKVWIQSYREYTGMTLPIFEGSKLAQSFRVGFVPAVVVVAPNAKAAYLKSGQQSFERLYEFVRTVQGLPAEMSPEVLKIATTAVGEEERRSGGAPKLVRARNGPQVATAVPAGLQQTQWKEGRGEQEAVLERF